MDDNLQHEKELCGDIVPRLFEDDVWKDINALDAEDTISRTPSGEGRDP